jgi:glycosyltransferase involved in cell wall biosynthesis
VTVIVPAWNVEAWIEECLGSVASQTLGLDRIRLVAVDDGSTDRTGALLDAFADDHPWATVIHQAASGGPGAPRNAGLDVATSDYVFFLDADDYLGPEALERLVAMADRNGSDIVLGRVVGVGGRGFGFFGRFRRNVDRADLELVNGSGNVHKLFRRSLFDRARLRFAPGRTNYEDNDLMQRAYVAAGTISVVADYDCYYLRDRPGSQVTRLDRDDDIAENITRIDEERIAVVVAERGPGIRRDLLVAGHIVNVAAQFRRRWVELNPEDRHRAFEVGAGVVARWNTPRIQRVLPPRAAIRTWCLANDRQAELEDIAAAPVARVYHGAIADGGRIYANYPHFRDGSGIPDACFDITRLVIVEQILERAEIVDDRLELRGSAHLRLVGGTTTVELRRWPRGPAYRFAATAFATPGQRDKTVGYPMAGWTASIGLATAAGGLPVPDGSWLIRLIVGTDPILRSAALAVGSRARSVVGEGGSPPSRARLYTTGRRTLRLMVGRPSPLLEGLERIDDGVRGTVLRALRAGVAVVERTRPGRLLVLVLEVYRPGSRSYLVED